MCPIRFSAIDCLVTCSSLQQQAQRYGKESAVAELMQYAVDGVYNETMIAALCRLLFVSRNGSPLRSPRLGAPGLIGDMDSAAAPLLPVFVHLNVPFCVVKNWLLAGTPEPASWYLAYCLLEGAWNHTMVQVPPLTSLTSVAHDFIRNGPWITRLQCDESTYLLGQVASPPSAVN